MLRRDRLGPGARKPSDLYKNGSQQAIDSTKSCEHVHEAPGHCFFNLRHAISSEEGFDLLPVDGVSPFPGLRMVVWVDRYTDVLVLIHGPFVSRVFTVHLIE